MYKDIAQDIGTRALNEIGASDLKAVPPMFRSAFKMALQWAKTALAGLTEDAAQRLIDGAISALEDLKKRVHDEREKRGLAAMD